MRKKTILSAALLSIAILSSATPVLAQSTVDAPNSVATQPSVTPSDTTGENTNMGTATTNSNENSTQQPSITLPAETVVAAPTAVVIEMPKADGVIIDKIINHHNNKEVEDIVAMFSKDGFIKIRSDGTVTKDPEELRKELVNFFADGKKYTFTAQVDSIKDLAPGVAVIGAYYNLFEEGQTIPKAKMYGITVIKYEDNGWKIVAQEATDLLAKESAEPAQPQSGGLKTAIIGLLGAAVGFLAGRVIYRKHPSQEA
jgi:hypothetical protein